MAAAAGGLALSGAGTGGGLDAGGVRPGAQPLGTRGGPTLPAPGPDAGGSAAAGRAAPRPQAREHPGARGRWRAGAGGLRRGGPGRCVHAASGRAAARDGGVRESGGVALRWSAQERWRALCAGRRGRAVGAGRQLLLAAHGPAAFRHARAHGRHVEGRGGPKATRTARAQPANPPGAGGGVHAPAGEGAGGALPQPGGAVRGAGGGPGLHGGGGALGRAAGRPGRSGQPHDGCAGRAGARLLGTLAAGVERGAAPARARARVVGGGARRAPRSGSTPARGAPRAPGPARVAASRSGADVPTRGEEGLVAERVGGAVRGSGGPGGGARLPDGAGARVRASRRGGGQGGVTPRAVVAGQPPPSGLPRPGSSGEMAAIRSWRGHGPLPGLHPRARSHHASPASLPRAAPRQVPSRFGPEGAELRAAPGAGVYRRALLAVARRLHGRPRPPAPAPARRLPPGRRGRHERVGHRAVLPCVPHPSRARRQRGSHRPARPHLLHDARPR